MKKEMLQIQSKTSVMQVLGCLIKSPTLLIDSNYHIGEEDFCEKFHKILFGAINNLFNNGTMVMDIPTICNYIYNFPSFISVFELNNGTEYIEMVSETSELENFEQNYKMMKKYTILRDLASNGVDIGDVYDYRETDPDKLDKQQKRMLEMTSSDILDHFMIKLNDIIQKHDMEDIGVKKIKASDRVRDVIESFKNTPDIGMKMYNEWYNTAFRGARTSKFYLESASSGCVDKDTEYFNGYEWKKISEYVKGEKVLQYNLDGSANLVLPERYIKVPCEEFNHIETMYGVNQTICDEHTMLFFNNENGKFVTMPFEEFKDRHNKNKAGLGLKIPTTFNYIGGNGIELTNEEIRLMIAVIADGSFREDCKPTWCRVNLKKTHKKIRFEKLLQDAKVEYIKRDREDGYTVYKFDAPRREKVFTKYWYDCSKEQLEIVANEVIHWDGSVNGKRRSFSTSIKESADFVQFVFSSLGTRATLSENDRRGQEYLTCGKMYTRKSMEYSVCLSSNSPYVGMCSNTKKMEIQRVKSEDGFKYCFTVDSGMFVTRRSGKINILKNCGKSRRQIREAVYMSVPYMYNLENKQWEETGVIPTKTTYICTELEEDEIIPIAVAFLSGVNEEKIKMCKMNEDEAKRVAQAIDIMETNDNFHMVTISDFDVDDIEKIIVDKILREGCKYFFFDYIHSTAKSLSCFARKTGIKLQEHQVLFLMAVSLKSICQKYKIFLYSATQINQSGMSGETRDEQALRGSKAIVDKVDGGVNLSRVDKKDLDKLKDIIAHSFGKTPTHCTSIYKNRGGSIRGVYLWSDMDLGIMRERFLFATDDKYNPIAIEMLDIIMKEEETIEKDKPTKIEYIEEEVAF